MLSTPFICCSSGVETDCSIVTASAPVYVVETMICGGTISGNCASGNPSIAMRPPMTVTIAITIATIGPSDEEVGNHRSSYSTRGCAGVTNGFGLTTISRSDFLHAFGDDYFARLQAVFNNPHRAAAFADFDWANAHLVVAPTTATCRCLATR